MLPKNDCFANATNCPRLLRNVIIIALLSASVSLSAQLAEKEPVPETHVIGKGESLYGIVAIYYPERMANWTDVAVDLVELNAKAFPDGLDTSLKLGREIRLPNYAARNKAARRAIEPTSNKNKVQESSTSNARPNDLGAPAASEPATIPNTNNRAQPTAKPTNTRGNRTPKIGVIMSMDGQAVANSSFEKPRSLKPGDIIYLGDTVETPSYTTTTVRLANEAEFQLKANSRLTFEQYLVKPSNAQNNTVVTLIAGGFSAKSGPADAKNPTNTTINTAVATIGVDGTQYGVKICQQDTCIDGSTTLENGLYTGVLKGSITLTNNTGSKAAVQGEFYHIKSPDHAPETAPYAATQLFSQYQLAQLENPPDRDKPLSFLGWIADWLFGD